MGKQKVNECSKDRWIDISFGNCTKTVTVDLVLKREDIAGVGRVAQWV
jgi:hypothetical protein